MRAPCALFSIQDTYVLAILTWHGGSQSLSNLIEPSFYSLQIMTAVNGIDIVVAKRNFPEDKYQSINSWQISYSITISKLAHIMCLI